MSSHFAKRPLGAKWLRTTVLEPCVLILSQIPTTLYGAWETREVKRQERECLEIDLEGFGKRVMPGACKTLGQCGQEEGAERGRGPGDPSKGRQLLGTARRAELASTACGFHKEAIAAGSPRAT